MGKTFTEKVKPDQSEDKHNLMRVSVEYIPGDSEKQEQKTLVLKTMTYLKSLVQLA